MSQSPVLASPHIHMLLKDLHYRSLEQEWNLPNPMPPRCTAKFNTIMRDKFIALDREKCEFVYQLLRATGAKTVVEAGTSFGVSTIYLALAVSQNTSGSAGGRVIATENEPEKARMAIQYWTEAGEDVSSAIDLRVGDLRETLKGDLGVVDFLLLDIWTPLALPTLQLVQPSLRPGAVIVADNTADRSLSYDDLFAYVDAPGSGFRRITMPYSRGLEFMVYHPES